MRHHILKDSKQPNTWDEQMNRINRNTGRQRIANGALMGAASGAIDAISEGSDPIETMDDLKATVSRWSAIIKEKEDSQWLKEYRAKLDGKGAPTGRTVEKGPPPFATSYGMGGVLPINGGPDPTKQKEKKGTPSIITRFFEANQRWGTKQ